MTSPHFWLDRVPRFIELTSAHVRTLGAAIAITFVATTTLMGYADQDKDKSGNDDKTHTQLPTLAPVLSP